MSTLVAGRRDEVIPPYGDAGWQGRTTPSGRKVRLKNRGHRKMQRPHRGNSAVFDVHHHVNAGSMSAARPTRPPGGGPFDIELARRK